MEELEYVIEKSWEEALIEENQYMPSELTDLGSFMENTKIL